MGIPTLVAACLRGKIDKPWVTSGQRDLCKFAAVRVVVAGPHTVWNLASQSSVGDPALPVWSSMFACSGFPVDDKTTTRLSQK